MNQFSLLSLSSLALEEVLKMMNPFDVVAFLKLSRKLKNIPRIYSWIFKQYLMVVNIDDESSSISLCGPVFGYKRILREDQLKMLAEQVKEVFNIGIHRLIFSMHSWSIHNKQVLDWVLSITRTMPSLALSGENVPHDDVEQILKEVKVTERLELHHNNKDNKPLPIPKGLNFLSISDGQWVKLKDLEKFDYPKMLVWRTTIEKRDLNTFLKEWVESKNHQNLRKLELAINAVEDLEQILDGIEHVETNPNTILDLGEADSLVHSGWEIQRNDGTIASVFEVEYRTVLFAAVWVHPKT